MSTKQAFSNSDNRSKVLIALKKNGQNGGPYISHYRIANDIFLKERYDFEYLLVPRSRELINPFGFFRFARLIKKSNLVISCRKV